MWWRAEGNIFNLTRGHNGVFFHANAISDALGNPIALAFIVETLVLMGVFSYLLVKWRIVRIHWSWFVGLSLLGGMAFALPIALLWPSGAALLDD